MPPKPRRSTKKKAKAAAKKETQDTPKQPPPPRHSVPVVVPALPPSLAYAILSFSECRHGCQVDPKQDPLLGKLVSEGLVYREENIFDSFETFARGFAVGSVAVGAFKKAISVYSAVGANLLLELQRENKIGAGTKIGDEADPQMQWLDKNLASTISMMESMICSGTTDFPAKHKEEYERAMAKSFRSVVLFFDKRIPCACLAGLAQDAKKGRRKYCDYCGSYAPEFECIQCHTTTYCSADCQVAAWPLHRPVCKELRAALRERCHENESDLNDMNHMTDIKPSAK